MWGWGLLLGEGKAEPKEVVTIRRRVDATVRRATVPRIVEPATATGHAVRPTLWTLWVGLFPIGIIVLIILIVTPFPYIAAHIIYTEFVRRFCSYGMGSFATIIIIPRHCINIIAATVFVTLASITAASCVFPLCFRRQTEALACTLV